MNPFEIRRHIPESELTFGFARSSGPGGQKVNKTSSKVMLRWNIVASQALTTREKSIVIRKLANRINTAGELYLDADNQRSQFQNKTFVIDLLERLVGEALIPEIPRVPTKPTRSSRQRRLDSKKKTSQKKESRSKTWD